MSRITVWMSASPRFTVTESRRHGNGCSSTRMSTGAALDEASLIEIVQRAFYPYASEWLFLRQLRVGTGHQNGGAQRLDAFALNTLPHTAMKRVCYEAKTSRADFLAEIKAPSEGPDRDAILKRVLLRHTCHSSQSYGNSAPACGLVVVEAGWATSRHGRTSSADTPAFSTTIPRPWCIA